jgi:voltage-gated potassium channel
MPNISLARDTLTMGEHLKDIILFVGHFLSYSYKLRGLLVFLLLMMVLGGVAIAYLEDLRWGESIYFAFITGLTVGYGDIEPVTPWGRVVSVAIAFVGLLFTGMTVAVATRALAQTVEDVTELKDK